MSTTLGNLASMKYVIQTALMDFLYQPVRQRHREQVEALIIRNANLSKTAVRAFRYKGELYLSDQAPRGPIMAPRLHPDLEPELAQMVQEQIDIHGQEEPLVKGFITAALNQSSVVSDYLELLPSCIHPPILTLMQQGHTGAGVYADTLFTANKEGFLAKHEHAIQLIRERMAINLLHQS